SGFDSKTSTSTPAFASWMAAASAAAPLPAIATFETAVMSEPLCSLGGVLRLVRLEDRHGVDRRPDRARDAQRGGREQEVVPPELRAHDAELVEVPQLADREPHVRDDDLVERLERRHVELVW